jgi:NADH-quinone oxidoreductase subunit C
VTVDELIAAVQGRAPEAAAAPADETRGQAVVMVPRGDLMHVLTSLRDDAATRFDRLVDLTAVDYLGRRPRFEVVYELHSLAHRHRLRVKTQVPEEDPVVPTASGLWKAALWAEREVFDLFGIRFDGHPDLRRILLYPEFEGHPLRKDYELLRRHPLVPERDPIERPWFPRGGSGA